ncbi:MAG: M23 family metallopeptidase [Clostridiales bacterium]|nr:M23 family metallopeptidase [Clostridiales bacterium]
MRKKNLVVIFLVIILFILVGIYDIFDLEMSTAAPYRKINQPMEQSNLENSEAEGIGEVVADLPKVEEGVNHSEEDEVILTSEEGVSTNVDVADAEQEGAKIVHDLYKMAVEETIELFAFLNSPIENASVTTASGRLPNASRSYRNGIHEGIDYYGFAFGTNVVAAADGIVIRVDHDFKEMTLEEYNEVIKISHEADITPEKKLDKLRGMQVWIEHQNGIITRYAHLDSVASDLKVGQTIKEGFIVGGIGNSGTKNSVVGKILSSSGAQHLHFEIWLGDVFLGKDLPYEDVLRIYVEVLDN